MSRRRLGRDKTNKTDEYSMPPHEDPDLEHAMEQAGEQALKEAEEKTWKQAEEKALEQAEEHALKQNEEKSLVAARGEQQVDAGRDVVSSDIHSEKESSLRDKVGSAGASKPSESAPTKRKLLINLTCGTFLCVVSAMHAVFVCK